MSAVGEQHETQSPDLSNAHSVVSSHTTARAPAKQSLLSQGILSAETKPSIGNHDRDSKAEPHHRNLSEAAYKGRPDSEGPDTPTTSNMDPYVRNMVPASPSGRLDPVRSSVSPNRMRYPYPLPSSPGRTFGSRSPSLHSPASSQIFERNVQEDIMPPQTSPGIPSHIITENHIPPILEASSVAITDKRLDPDSVEIITHSLHQPAALAVAGASTADQSVASSWHEEAGQHPFEDTASVYGALDSNDVKRLSFISFADVVNAENAENSEQFYNTTATLTSHNRSPSPARSPARSPVSSRGLGTSPPTSLSPSLKGLEMSPNRMGRGLPSPLQSAQSPLSANFGGELNVETMRQALRRTGSADLSGVRSQALSTVDNDEGAYDRPIK